RIFIQLFLNELKLASGAVRDVRYPQGWIQIEVQDAWTICQDVDRRSRLGMQFGAFDRRIDFLMLNIHQTMVFVRHGRCSGIVVRSKMKRAPDAEVVITETDEH